MPQPNGLAFVDCPVTHHRRHESTTTAGTPSQTTQGKVATPKLPLWMFYLHMDQPQSHASTHCWDHTIIPSQSIFSSVGSIFRYQICSVTFPGDMGTNISLLFQIWHWWQRKEPILLECNFASQWVGWVPCRNVGGQLLAGAWVTQRQLPDWKVHLSMGSAV